MHTLDIELKFLGSTVETRPVSLSAQRIACLEPPPPHKHANSEIAQLLTALRFKKVSPTQVLPANAYDSAGLCSNIPRDHLLGPTGNRRLQDLRQRQILTDRSTLRAPTHSPNCAIHRRHTNYLRYKHNNGQPASCESQERPLRRHTHPYRP